MHVKASAEVIARRMRENPHPHSALREEDIPEMLRRYDAACAESTLRHKITLDTSETPLAETMREFQQKIEPHLTENDRSRIMLRRAWR